MEELQPEPAGASSSPPASCGGTAADDNVAGRSAEKGSPVELPNHELLERLSRGLGTLDKVGCSLPVGGARLRRFITEFQADLHRRAGRVAQKGKGDADRHDQPWEESDEQCEKYVEFNDRLNQSRLAESSGSDLNTLASSKCSDDGASFFTCFNQRLEAKDTKQGTLEYAIGGAVKDTCRGLTICKPQKFEEKLQLIPAPASKETMLKGTSFEHTGDIAGKNEISLSSDCSLVGSSTSTFQDANLSSNCQKRRLDPVIRCSLRLKSKKAKEIILLDEEVQELETSRDGDISTKWRSIKLYYPSREDPDSVELTYDDIKCLDPESYVSSSIMNFYIKYLQRPTSASRPKCEYHFFNTFFFGKLEELMLFKGDITDHYLKLRRWWKGVSIFEKGYIFLPVHGDMHWSLVIICIPAKKDESGPTILHLDSLQLHSSRAIMSIAEKFLKEEWNFLNKYTDVLHVPISERVWKKLPNKIEKRRITTPQQSNVYDCGLFVLYFMERFIESAPERLKKKDIQMFGKKWFQPEEASALRKQILHLLLELFESAKQDEKDAPQLQAASPAKDG